MRGRLRVGLGPWRTGAGGRCKISTRGDHTARKAGGEREAGDYKASEKEVYAASTLEALIGLARESTQYGQTPRYEDGLDDQLGNIPGWVLSERGPHAATTQILTAMRAVMAKEGMPMPAVPSGSFVDLLTWAEGLTPVGVEVEVDGYRRG